MPARWRFRLLLVLLALTVCAVLNPGNFGTFDTRLRLQAERWIRLGEPPSRPGDPGLKGRGGVAYPWYGVGQSLVMLPFDAAVSATITPLAGRLGFDQEKQRQIAELSIAFLMQALLTSAVLLFANTLLESFGFSPFAAAAGTLSLLLATTCLPYVQCAQENELLLTLSLGALVAIVRWQGTGRIRWAILAGALCGFAVLVRLPSLLEATVFAAWALWMGGRSARFLAGYVPGVAAGVFLDRWYQWLRFGEWSSTYMGILGRQTRPPGMPASYPFSYPFAKGFAGAFLSADKSILLFDPLLLVLAVLLITRWRSIDGRVRAALVSLAVLLLLYVSFYARYYDFGGDSAWGYRFLTLPVQLLALFAVPILLAAGAEIPPAIRRGAWVVVALAAGLQTISTTMSPNVEVEQRDTYHSRTGVVVNRVENLAAVLRGKLDDPRFGNIPMESRLAAYLPFQLKLRFPRLAGWAIAVWWLAVAAVPFELLASLATATRLRKSGT